MQPKVDLDFAFLLPSDATERRAAVLHAEQERAEQRRQELDSQCAPSADPQERIRIWERLHGLQLPKSVSHPLLAVIAAQTNLSSHAVAEEQRRRRDALTPEVVGT